MQRTAYLALLLVAGVIACAPARASAQDAAWHVAKSSGEVWIVKAGAPPVAGKAGSIVSPGDQVRTGPNGQVALIRDKDTIQIAPDTAFDIAQKTDNGAPAIFQRTGSLLLDVRQREFKVETPYLAAVVSGGSFRVVVEDDYAHVDALRGQVDVADFKSGQSVTLAAGQTAEVAIRGKAGLSLSGVGQFAEIHQAQAQQSVVPQSSPPVAVLPEPLRGSIAEPTPQRTERLTRAEPAKGITQPATRETVAAIDTFLSPAAHDLDSRKTKAEIDKFFSSPEQRDDPRATKAAIEKFFSQVDEATPTYEMQPARGSARSLQNAGEIFAALFRGAQDSTDAPSAQPMLTAQQLRLRFTSADPNASVREAPLSAPAAEKETSDDSKMSIVLSVGIGAVVAFLLAMFRRGGRQKETARLDYTY